MARAATMNVSLTAEELRLVRQRVRAGEYASESDVVRQSLRLLFGKSSSARTKRVRGRKASSSTADANLAAAYRACARHDRRTAQQWAQLADPWPDE